MGEPKRLTVEQYDELFVGTYDDAVEFDGGEMLLGGVPFFELAVGFLEMLGYEVREAGGGGVDRVQDGGV